MPGPEPPVTTPGGSDRRRVTAPLLAAWAVIAVALLAVVLLSLRHEIYSDEIEHVHAGWLVSTGKRPFTDFFEHHHPLFWYLLAVVLPWTSQSASTLVHLRLVMLIPFAGIVVLCFRLARLGGAPRLVPWLAVALLVSMSEFARVAMQIRPDVPATLSVLAGVVVLLRALEGHRPRTAAAAGGGLLGIGLLFSLKTLLPIAVTLAAVLWCWRRRRTSTAVPLLFLLGCAFPAAAYASYLLASGGLRDYWVANWALNAVVTGQKARVRPPQPPVFVNAGFWLAAVAGVVWVAFRRRAPAGVQWAVLVGAGVAGLLVASGRTESRSAVVTFPFLAIAAAWALAEASRRLRLAPASTAAVLVALCAAPVAQTLLASSEDNRAQLERIDDVLARTPPGEPVYDANGAFNVFRPDLHYFWFFVGPGRNQPLDDEVGRRQRAYLVSRLGPGSYDPCALVAAARPRIVSTHRIDLAACGLADVYRPTRHPGILERRE